MDPAQPFISPRGDHVPGHLPVRLRRSTFLHVPASLPWWTQESLIHRARLRDLMLACPDGVAVLESAVVTHGGVVKPISPRVHLKYEGPDGAQMAAKEERRRMALEAAGYTVVPLSTEQCFDTPALSESFRIHAGPTRGQDLPRLLTKFEREF